MSENIAKERDKDKDPFKPSTVTSTGTGADREYTSGATEVEAGTATADEVRDMRDDIIESGGTYNIGGRNEGGLMTSSKRRRNVNLRRWTCR